MGAQQKLTDAVTLHADVNWMGWSRIREIALAFDNPAQGTETTPLPWDDSIFVAIGASWDATEALTLRAGAAYDQGPARNGGASVAIPDGNSVYLATGLSYRRSEALVIDAALGAAITEDVDVTAPSSAPGATFRGDFSGRYDGGRAYFAGLQMRMGF